MKAADWIDRLKEAKGWDSDYRVSKEMEIAHSTISRYRNKPESTMDDDTAVKVAGALQVEPELVVLDQVAERTRSAPARAALSGLLEKLTGKKQFGHAVGSGVGRGRVDITSVTQCTREGELPVPRSRQYASYPPTRTVRLAPAVLFWLQSLMPAPVALA